MGCLPDITQGSVRLPLGKAEASFPGKPPDHEGKFPGLKPIADRFIFSEFY